MWLSKINSLQELEQLKENLFHLAVDRFGWSTNVKPEKVDEIAASFLGVADWSTAKMLVMNKKAVDQIGAINELSVTNKPIHIIAEIYFEKTEECRELDIAPFLLNTLKYFGIHAFWDLLSRLQVEDKTVKASLLEYFNINPTSEIKITIEQNKLNDALFGLGLV